MTAALHALPPEAIPDGSVLLTVGAEGVSYPPTMTADLRREPPMSFNLATPEAIASSYHHLSIWYDHVMAIAPSTMTVLNTDPNLANLPLSELAARRPLQFLLATLTDQQMSQLASDGLTLQDMTPDQQAFFKAALPHPFEIVPSSAHLMSWSREDEHKTGVEYQELFQKTRAAAEEYKRQIQTLPDSMVLQTIRLHAFLNTDFTFAAPGGSNLGIDPNRNNSTWTGPFKLVRDGRELFADDDQSKHLEGYLKAEVPNTLKQGDMDWGRDELSKTILLDGLTNVDSLIARLAKATGLELYADLRYGRQSLEVMGDLKTPQSASDLMQALCLCVSGTWRQVGPAWVLTDDVQGLGARQEHLQETVQTWSNRLTEADRQIGLHLEELNWATALHYAKSDVSALSDAQIDTILKNNSRGGYYGKVAWSDLSTTTQQALKSELTRSDYEDNFGAAAKSIASILTPDFKVGVNLNLQFALDLPLTGPMLIGNVYRVQTPRTDLPGAHTTKPFEPIKLTEKVRGVLCAPRTPEEAQAVVDKLPSLGFNTLFCDVFCSGHALFPNNALPPMSRSDAHILQTALSEAALKHIAVYAVIDTLCWRRDSASTHSQSWPRGFTEDLTITGETPDQFVQRRIASKNIRIDLTVESILAQEGSQSWASPADPNVQIMLPKLVHALAQTPGIAGLMFQDTASPAYFGNRQWNLLDNALGFEPQIRLAYLRAHHLDPIDNCPSTSLQLFLPYDGSSWQFNVEIREFDRIIDNQWQAMLNTADMSLLADCYREAHETAPKLPLLMRERQMGIWIDPWTDPKVLNQVPSTNSLDNPDQWIGSQTILDVPYGLRDRSDLGSFIHSVEYYRKKRAGGRASGIIVDFLTQGRSQDLVADLTQIAPAFTP